MKKCALKVLSVVAGFFILFSVTACGDRTGEADDGSLQAVLNAGKFVIGVDSEYPPMSFFNDSGDMVGFDVDCAQEVCNRLGITLVKKPIDWSKKEELLNSGEIDCIWSGFVITSARAKSMLLSEPYIKNEVIFVVKSDSDARTTHDLKDKKVGVQSGSAPEDALKNSDVYNNVTVVEYSSSLELLQGLKDGKVDAALADSINAYYYIFSSDERFFVLPDSLEDSECAIGFRKADVTLRDKIQEIISEMKGDGTLGNISKKWFGSDITIVR